MEPNSLHWNFVSNSSRTFKCGRCSLPRVRPRGNTRGGVAPLPPEGPDIFQSRLFDDRVVCFFDGNVRSAPESKEAFCAADYIEVRFEDDETALIPFTDTEVLVRNRPRVSVPNFSALAAFLRGSHLISSQASLMGRVNLTGFDSAPLPLDTKPFSMYMAWHRRDHMDPAHQWLRRRIKTFVDQILHAREADTASVI